MSEIQDILEMADRAYQAGEVADGDMLVKEAERISNEPPSTTMDALKSFGSGAARGAMELAGLPGTLQDITNTGVNKLFDMVGADPLTQEQIEVQRSGLSGASFRDKASNITGGATEYQPKTTAGEYARTIGEFAPGAALGGGTIAGALKYGLAPAVTSETAGQFTKGSQYEPYARVGAALATPMAISGLRKAVTPFTTPKQNIKDAAILQKEGIKLTAGQKTGNKRLKYTEAGLGGTAAEDFVEQQGRQFTRAALKRIGVNADNASPEVIDRAFKTIGKKFERLIGRNRITVDKQLVDDLVAANDEYVGNVAKVNRAPFVKTLLEDAAQEIKAKGYVSGKTYQRIREKLGKKLKNSGAEGEAARNIQEALDSAMERGLVARGSVDAGKFQEARGLYRNLLVIERTMGAAGEKAAQGLISPAQLRMAAKTKHGLRNYVRGKSDFSDLARAGNSMMTPLPTSGTSERLLSRLPLSEIVGGGAGAALTGGSIPGMAVGIAAGKVAPALAGRAMLSGAGRSYLGNQLMPSGGMGLIRYPTMIPGLLANR
ncbi:MAG: hypothetical protein GY943_30620 [Chloroflexi bacterium]|nr:hypothetical protein [Chloroflexota bacterium]